MKQCPETSLPCHAECGPADCEVKANALNTINQQYEGLFIPEYCPRQRTDCKALFQLIAENHASFICCGENDGTNRTVEQDKYRICIKSSEDNDIMQDCDKRDLTHQASVIIGALASIEQTDSAAYHKNPNNEEHF